jgi:hypothetical protein
MEAWLRTDMPRITGIQSQRIHVLKYLGSTSNNESKKFQNVPRASGRINKSKRLNCHELKEALSGL